MAEARKVVGWFYRNGRRIPIFEKRERDVKEGTYQGKSVTVGSEVDVPGGKGTVQRLYETSNPDLMYKNRIRVKNNETGDEIDMANGDELNPKFGKTGLRKPLSPNSVKARDRKNRNEVLDYGDKDVATARKTANVMDRRVRTADGEIVRPVKRTGIDLETRINNSIGQNPEAYGITPNRAETAFTDSRGERQWAKNVDSLPEKKNKFSNGYGKIGSTEKADIYADRDSTSGDYYAVPKSAPGKKPLATGKGSLRMNNNSEMRRRMWGTPGVPGKEKPTFDIRGKKRSSYDIPQRRAFAGKPIEESYIKYVMEEYGFSRADAIKLIKDKREGK